jgi:hypothetical protein
MRNRLVAAALAVMLTAMSVTPSFAATTEYTCNQSYLVTGPRGSASGTSTFEATYDLTLLATTYQIWVYTVTVKVSCSART